MPACPEATHVVYLDRPYTVLWFDTPQVSTEYLRWSAGRGTPKVHSRLLRHGPTRNNVLTLARLYKET